MFVLIVLNHCSTSPNCKEYAMFGSISIRLEKGAVGISFSIQLNSGLRMFSISAVEEVSSLY